MFVIAITIILFTNICSINTKIIIPQNVDKTWECVNELLSNTFKQKNIFYLNSDKNVDDILKVLHKNENLLTVINSKKGQSTLEEKTYHDIFLIQIKSLPDFLNFLSNDFAIANSKANFLILHYGNKKDGEAILQIAWKYYLLNINVVVVNNAEILSYLAYRGSNCHEVIDISVKDCQDAEFLEDLFPNKVPWDLQGCDTKFGASLFPPFVLDVKNSKFEAKILGLEGILYKTILKKMNSKENITFDYDGIGTKYPNGTMTGALSTLRPHKTDIVFGHLWPNSSFFKEADMFYPFFSDSNRWFAPKALQLAKWKCLFVILQAHLWAIIFILFVINTFVWWAIAKHTEEIQPFQNIGQCLLYGFYILCLGSSPQPNKFIMRLLVINWTLNTLLLAVIYQSQLLTILTSPIYEHQIKEVTEIPGTNLRVLTIKAIIPTLTDFPKELFDWFLTNTDFVEIEELMRKTVQYDRTFIFVSTFYWMKSVAGLYYTNDDGSPMVAALDTKYISLSIPICGYATKGFPLLDRYNEIAFRLHAGGFLAKWLRDIDSSFYGRSSKDPIRLTLEHVAGGFFLLFCGLGVSFLGFVGEFMVYSYRRSKLVFVD